MVGSRLNVEESGQNCKKSFLKKYGILVLPMVLMVTFGMFGFRPGQAVNRKLGYIINVLYFLNFTLVAFVGLGYLISTKNYDNSTSIFLGVSVVFMMVKFSCLCFIFYKKHNLICLLEDITKIRKHCLNRKEILFIIITFILIMAQIAYMGSFFLEIVLDVFKNGSSFYGWTPYTIQTDNPVGIRILVIFEILVYMNITWSSALITSFIVVVGAIVMTHEFEKCNQELKDQIKKENSLSCETFDKFTKRFYELKQVSNRADNVFCVILLLNLILSFGMLCGAIYASLIKDTVIRDWSIPIFVSVQTALMLLLPVASIHKEVNLSLTVIIYTKK